MAEPLSFILSASSTEGAPGFWALDLSEEVRTPNLADYADLWIAGRTPERISLRPAPEVSLDIGIDGHGHRFVEASRGSIAMADSDPEAVAEEMIQRKFFIYASNRLPSSDLPAFLSTRSSVTTNAMEIVLQPMIKTFWESPDVRLGIERQRLLFASFFQRAAKRLAEKYPNSAMQFEPPDPTRDYEQVARALSLHAGLYLPVAFDLEQERSLAVLRLNSSMDTTEAKATLFVDKPVSRLRSGTEFYRRAFFKHEAHLHEAKAIVGAVA